MLFLTKAKKFGMVTVMGILLGLISFLMGRPWRVGCAAIPIALFLLIRRPRTALIYAAACIAMLLTEGVVIPNTKGILNLLIVITMGPFSRILAGYAFAYYIMCSTTVSEFVTAMRKMRVPDAVTKFPCRN